MKVAVLFIRSRITPLFLIKKPASHSSDNELDMVHGTPSSDKSVNELDYSVVSDSKATSASHSSDNELDRIPVIVIKL